MTYHKSFFALNLAKYLALSIALIRVANAYEVKPLSKEIADEYKLDQAFFKS